MLPFDRKYRRDRTVFFADPLWLSDEEISMASTAGKWAIGCGIGCLVIILIAVVVGYGGVKLVQKTVDEAKEMGEAMQSLAEEYGQIGEYVPATDGTIAADRLEAFLRVREAMAESRAAVETTFATLSKGESEGVDSAGDVLGMFKAGAGIVPRMMEFISQRTDALLAEEMGLGEYTHIYVLSYFSWLGMPPEDGPAFQLVGNNVSYSSSDDEEAIRRQRKRIVLETVNLHLLEMLENQQSALEAAGGGDESWQRALAHEIVAMNQDRDRLPWQDGLPPQLEASLEPYRERLESSYSALCNPLEVGIGFD
jgi:hypothetical protein